ncbi:aspartate aminotransferase family protein [Halorarum halophilum]|uniref:Aspartate aminotransferase family protein n=1 Tax=Halorarum halophilum TaxID=2743090 RepID=A0A7D5L2Q6_9EURY|nr:aspartate aminotransferase family protein [Halobaculum halophilum]QLG27443.1 aspartate aminotransferase family protein [Halobaculum halophilum]
MANERARTGGSTDTTAIPHWYDPDSSVPTIVEGEDATVFDDSGTAYLDFQSQLYCVNAGHSNEAIVEAMTEQARRIPYVSSAKHNDTRSALAGRLGEIAPGSLSDVYFAISGSEANETAAQIARVVKDAPKVLTRWQSYHGGTAGAGSLTGDPDTRATLERHAATTGAGKFLPPLPECFDADSPEDLAEQAADHVEFVIRNEGADSVAAILMEPIAGTSGAYTAPPGYFERLREICDEYDVLLISDEVIAGFGRCGEWFGIDTEGVDPDMITFAKGVTSAYVPLAGVVVDEGIGETVRADSFDLGQTFAGHPVGCAAGLAAIEEYEGGLIDNVAEVGPHLESRLRDLEDEYDVVDTVRGRGLLWSVVFADSESGEPLFDPLGTEEGENPVAAVRSAAQEQGTLFGAGRPDVQVIVSPPLCVTEAEIDEAVDALSAGIEETFGG